MCFYRFPETNQFTVHRISVMLKLWCTSHSPLAVDPGPDLCSGAYFDISRMRKIWMHICEILRMSAHENFACTNVTYSRENDTKARPRLQNYIF